MGALENLTTAGNPLYWTLQEFIYANGTLDAPINWTAEHEYARHPEFDATARPLMLTGEAAFPFMFEDDPLLAPLKPAVDLLMQDTEFDPIYDEHQLAANEVPLQAASCSRTCSRRHSAEATSSAPCAHSNSRASRTRQRVRSRLSR